MSGEEIDLLIAKFLSGEATPEEAMFITDWVAQSEKNKILFEQSQQVWSFNEKRILPISKKEKTWNVISEKISPKKRTLYFTPLKIAASITLLIAISISIYLLKSSSIEEQWITKNSKQEIFKLSLSDSTVVVLNKNSELSYPKEFKNARTVKLSGEAFFDVVPNPTQPFIIEYDEISIKVLGTAFNVSHKDSSTIETQVIRGKVMMFNKDSSIIIDAKSTGIYDKLNKKFSVRKNISDNSVGYATHTFTYDDTPMKQVTDELSRSFGVSFVFENEKLKECRLASSFNNKPLSFILDIIAETMNITYIIKGNIVYLSGDGCL